MTIIFMISYVVLWALAILLVVALFALARQIGVLHVRLPAVGARLVNAGPEVGAALPEFQSVDILGQDIVLGGSHLKNALLLFLSPGCSSCADLVPAIKAVQKSEAKLWDIVLISIDGDIEANQEFVRRNGLEQVTYVVSREFSESSKVGGTPFGVVLDRQGIVRSKGVVNTLEHMESLLNAVELGHTSIERLFQEKSLRTPKVREAASYGSSRRV